MQDMLGQSLSWSLNRRLKPPGNRAALQLEQLPKSVK